MKYLLFFFGIFVSAKVTHCLKECIFPHPFTVPIFIVHKAAKMKERKDESINI